jgi:photosystem II stability/assembly factor-like uncharacterized protein
VTLLLVAADARPNGRYPTASQILPSAGDQVVLNVTFGLVISQDRGTTWRWVCEEAMGLSAQAQTDPPAAVTNNGTILVGVRDTVASSTDGGCSWRHTGPRSGSIVDLTVTTTSVYAVTMSRSIDGQGVRYGSQVERSDDEGQSWVTLGTIPDSSFRSETIEVAASDPSRIYVSGARWTEVGAMGALAVSRDGGQTWNSRVVPFVPDENGVFIAAVHPRKAGLVYLRTAGGLVSRLVVTHDAGETLLEPFTTNGPMSGFALSDDGETVYAGGPLAGLWGSIASGSFEQRSALPVRCLASKGAALYSCSDSNTAFLVGSSEDGGRVFQSRLSLGTVEGIVSCADPTVPSLCAGPWRYARDRFGLGARSPAELDAAPAPPGPPPTEDAAEPPPAPQVARRSSGCGCRIGDRAGAGIVPVAVTGGVGLVVLRLRQRRRARRRAGCADV